MQKPLYIFDIDGTLTDSIPTYIKAITQVLSDIGLTDIDTDYDNYLHHTDRYALAYNYETLLTLQKNNIPFAYGTGAFPKATIVKMNQAKLPLIKEVLATSMHSMTREGFVKQAIDKAKTYYNQIGFQRVIAVGDGLWDLRAAQNVGIEFIGVGLKNKQALLDAGCELWIEDLTDFPIIQ